MHKRMLTMNHRRMLYSKKVLSALAAIQAFAASAIVFTNDTAITHWLGGGYATGKLA